MNDLQNNDLLRIKEFLRYEKGAFDMLDLLYFLDLENKEENIEKIAEFILGEALAYYIPNEDSDDGLWISRQSFFTDKVFSVKASDYELKNNIFIPASRFLPFTHISNTHKEIKILYNGKEVQKKEWSMPFEKISSFYFLDSENTISHILCEENQKNIETFGGPEDNFSASDNFLITAWDFSSIFNYFENINNSVKFLVRILDWELGIFEILDKKTPNISSNTQEKWLDTFEYGVKNSLSIMPLNVTTHEVISFAFFICGDLLFTKNPVPMELFFEIRNTFKIKPYGIEEKFWLTDKPIPVPTIWFDYPISQNNLIDLFFLQENLPITENAVDNIILNFLQKNYLARFDKNIKQNFIFETINILMPLHTKNAKRLCSKIIEDKYDFLVNSYNPFVDADVKNLREAVVIFYKQILIQLIEITKYNLKPKDVEDQAALIFNQILFKILQTFDFISRFDDEDYNFLSVLYVSLENLTLVFNEINVKIKNAIKSIRNT